MDADGDFVVAWTSQATLGANDGVYAQRYNAVGVAQGSNFRVNTYTTGFPGGPSVATDATGNFVVTWSSGQDGSALGVYAQRYNAAGGAQGSEFQVNTYTTGYQRNRAVAIDAAGDFVVTWTSVDQDGSNYGVYAQSYNAAGVAQGSEFRVNTYTTGSQGGPSVAMDADGDFVVAWYSSLQDGSSYGVYAQRYIDTVPATVTEVRTQTGEVISQAETIDHAISSLTIQFSRNMSTVGGTGGANSVTNPANYQLLQGVTDISGSITGVTYAYDPATARFEATLTLSPSLPNGSYQLTVLDSVQSEHSQALDGDSNSVAGGDFVVDFSVVSVVPDGPEFQVNTYTTSNQQFPAVAMDAAGDYVVAWVSDGQDGHSLGIFAQRYDAAGVAQGSEFQVNTYTTNNQWLPSVAMDADGDFVVAWQSQSQDGSGYGIYAQRYNAAGLAQGSEFRVNTYTTSNQQDAKVAMDADGDFVVAWRSYQDGGYDVYAQRYNTAGVAQGSEFRVNTYTTSEQATPAVAMDADGDFVVAWRSAFQDGSVYGVYAQRYSAAGVAQGSEFRVNTYTTSNQHDARVAMDADGDFVVAWHSFGQDGSGRGIYAQRYNAAGVAQGSEFRVNTYTTDSQSQPSVAMDDGDFVVAWGSYGQDGSSEGVYAQRYNAAGVAQGSEFQVNTYTTGSQLFPSVAMDADGDFVVAWQSQSQDSGNAGIYAQRYINTTPATVTDVTLGSIIVQFSRNVSTVGGSGGAHSATNPANYQLFQGMTDISGSITGISYAYNPATAHFEATLTVSPPLSGGSHQLIVRDAVQSEHGQPLDGDGDGVPGGDAAEPFEVPSSSIAGRHIFYNQSTFDGNSAAINANDNNAIAPDKSPLFIGAGQAVLGNITNYTRGLNGIMVDLSTGVDHSGISAADFIFKVGANNSPSLWSVAPAPSALSVTAGGGVSGADRVTITWADNAIANQYLQVAVRANANTGLAPTGIMVDPDGPGAAPAVDVGDVFFWGHLMGETASTTPAGSFARTVAADRGPILTGGTQINVGITSRLDINKSNGITIAADGGPIVTAGTGLLPRINIGVAGPFAPEGDDGGDAGIASALASTSTCSPEASNLVTTALPRGIGNRLQTLDLNSGRIAASFQHSADQDTPGTRKILTKIYDVSDEFHLDEELLDWLLDGFAGDGAFRGRVHRACH
ncbi:MAG: hypothetical protein WD845_14115 [Pirellulales bacterium]